LLLATAVVGAIDVIGIHHLRERIAARPEARAEAIAHVAKGLVYVTLFLVVPNLALHGAWALGLLGLVLLDAACGAWDLTVETRSATRGGRVIAPDETALHIVLSVLAGATLWELGGQCFAASSLPPAISHSSSVPVALRIALACAAVGVAGVVGLEIAALRGARGADLETLVGHVMRRRPIHIAIDLPVSAERLWATLSDHVAQPTWDGRFSRISMRGTELRYETRLGPIVFVGHGRVMLERPLRQSSFAFDSADPKNPILEGRGVWLVDAHEKGVIFRTSYDYDVRWGALGALVDRFAIRPWFTRQTARSFERLAKLLGHAASAETGDAARSLARRLRPA